MKTPVFRFQEEVVTDAPLDLLLTRLGTPRELPSLRGLCGLCPLEREGEDLVLRWQRHGPLGTVEEGTLRATPHERGAHLRLDGRLRGWAAFLTLGWVRLRMERLLYRLVSEL
jgi:hypothetical protein